MRVQIIVMTRRLIAATTLHQILLLTCVLGQNEDKDQHLSNYPEQQPLEISDIMPLAKKSYDKMRPPKFKNNATEVLFHVTVMSLDTIDESSMTYTCDVFFAQSWKDNRLRLPDNMTSEYRLLPIEWLTEIWRPDSFFKNAKSVTFQTMTIPNHYIWLWKDKTILYMVKLTLVLSCPMHFKNYPHDTQTCNLEIESISHTTDDLIFIWDPQMPLDVDKGIELPQLELISTKNDDCTTEYSTGKFTCLEVVFKFKRRLGYYLFHTYVPTCLIVIMSWISFWIKPEAVPARVTLGVTSLLTLSTQHANSQKSLPPVSYIKAIDVFMSGCTVFVFLSLMEYALVNIVMGDIADIEKKKSMGISNLILGSRGLPIRSKEGGINQEEVLKYANMQEQRTFKSFIRDRIPKMNLNSRENSRNVNGSNSIPMTMTQQQQLHQQHIGDSNRDNDTGGFVPLHPSHHTQISSAHSSQQSAQHAGRQPNTLNVNNLIGNSTTASSCIHQRGTNHLQVTQPPSNTNHTTSMDDQIMSGAFEELTPYFMNRDGCMEATADAAPEVAIAAGASGMGGMPPVPPPPLSMGGSSNPNVITPGIKSLVHDVQLKRQKEIREIMKKKREKAMLVDRISRWLFPTSFILLNIVYWALFGDHGLWDNKGRGTT